MSNSEFLSKYNKKINGNNSTKMISILFCLIQDFHFYLHIPNNQR